MTFYITIIIPSLQQNFPSTPYPSRGHPELDASSYDAKLDFVADQIVALIALLQIYALGTT